jgi:dCMP deaminase
MMGGGPVIRDESEYEIFDGVKIARPSWDAWGLAIAQAIALRGDCRRRQIGAVIMDARHKIIGTGYNGVAPGQQGCIDGGCPRAFTSVEPNSSYDTGPGRCIAVHAEANSVADAGAAALMSSSCTIYITQAPCLGCQNLLDRFLIRVVYPGCGAV